MTRSKEIIMYRTIMYVQAEYLAEVDTDRKKELYDKIQDFNQGEHIVGEFNDDSYSILKQKTDEEI